MDRDSTLNDICPILSIAGTYEQCLKKRCKLFCTVLAQDGGLEFCALTLSALALDKAAREGARYG